MASQLDASLSISRLIYSAPSSTVLLLHIGLVEQRSNFCSGFKQVSLPVTCQTARYAARQTVCYMQAVTCSHRVHHCGKTLPQRSFHFGHCAKFCPRRGLELSHVLQIQSQAPQLNGQLATYQSEFQQASTIFKYQGCKINSSQAELQNVQAILCKF